jgi:hypothetical protein
MKDYVTLAHLRDTQDCVLCRYYIPAVRSCRVLGAEVRTTNTCDAREGLDKGKPTYSDVARRREWLENRA